MVLHMDAHDGPTIAATTSGARMRAARMHRVAVIMTVLPAAVFRHRGAYKRGNGSRSAVRVVFSAVRVVLSAFDVFQSFSAGRVVALVRYVRGESPSNLRKLRSNVVTSSYPTAAATSRI